MQPDGCIDGDLATITDTPVDKNKRASEHDHDDGKHCTKKGHNSQKKSYDRLENTHCIDSADLNIEPPTAKKRKRGPYRPRCDDHSPPPGQNVVKHNKCEVKISNNFVAPYVNVSKKENCNTSSAELQSSLNNGEQQLNIGRASVEVTDNLNYIADSQNEFSVDNDYNGPPIDDSENIDYVPLGNDEFDKECDMLIDAIQADLRIRNSDVLNDADSEYEPCIIQDDVPEVVNNVNEATDYKTKTDIGSNKLYEGSNYTVAMAVLLICCFIIRFRLPDTAGSYMLQIISCLLPQGNRLMSTWYFLRQYIKSFASNMLPFYIIYHCNLCYSEVERKSDSCKTCNTSLTRPGSLAYVVHLKIIPQLVTMWLNPEFANEVRNHRFSHYKKKRPPGSISDIYDSNLYRNKFDDNGILSNPNNLSFAMNTDGVPLFKSSSISIWPIYLLVNELPIALRKRRQYSIVSGIWISSRKPQMWAFMKPVYDELKTLEQDGHMFSDSEGKTFTSKAILLTITCDLPARALVYNCNQYNGENSCWYCLDKGETYTFEQTGGHCHVFPYNSEMPKGKPRTSASVKEDVSKVKENLKSGIKKYIVNGHKGPFWFMYLSHFDVIKSCVIDYMHGVCLGVTKTLLNLWFDKSNKNEDFSLFTSKDKVSELMISIKPAVFVTRLPRSLADIGHWKSSEFRNFLLFWGIPVLHNVLDDAYFVHFCLLARAIHCLSKETITANDLEVADHALLLFVENFESLYSLRYCTLNLHQLLHLVDCVRNTGPLFANNCFVFEDINGYIIKHVHGTQGVEYQLLNTIEMVKVIPVLFDKHLNKYDSDTEAVTQLCEELRDSVHSRHKLNLELEDGVRLVDRVTKTKTLSDDEMKLLGQFDISENNVESFLRVNMYKLGFYVYAKEYQRLVKRQQNVVSILFNGKAIFASVCFFIKAKTENKTFHLAYVSTYKTLKKIGCVFEVTNTDDKIFVPIKSITSVNNIVINGNRTYICPPPNRYERD